jgi:[NiFe] hydrogenase assembly HybE family chaperone
MNDPASPAALLAETFDRIARTRMDGVALLNPALRVEAIDFAPWSHYWLGVLVTPWFMNLVILPRDHDQWHSVRVSETVSYTFPAGVFGFIAAAEPPLGEMHACSLFSPMFEFADHETACVAAVAARAALFDAAHRDASVTPDDAPRAGAAMSKREFLRLPDHEPGR